MHKLFAAFLAIFLVASSVVHAATPQRREGIAAVVNNQAITVSDVNDRLKLIMASAGLPNNKDVIAKVTPQVVSSLIEETIKRQEADRLSLKVTDAEVDAAINDVASQNKMTGAQFREMFRQRGMPIRTLRDQITSQLLWVKVVTKQLRPQIEVTESDIDAELENLTAKIGKDEYLLGEIVLPVDRPQDEQNGRDLAAKLVAQIRAQPQSFPALAQQFSKSAGAAQGGGLGWISVGQLPPELDQELPAAKAGDVIGPVKTPTGIHILLVRDKRARTAETLPTRDAVAQRIGLERLDRMQRRYFMDLKSSAFLDAR